MKQNFPVSAQMAETLLYTPLGEYTGAYRETARLAKMSDPEAIILAGTALARILPRCATLVPVPSHEGRATYTLMICAIIARHRKDIRVCDCLEADCHESLCELKNREWAGKLPKGSLLPPPGALGIRLCGRAPSGDGPVCLVDNVVASGRTAIAAASALPHADGIWCIASDETYPKLEGVRRAPEQEDILLPTLEPMF